MLDRAQRRGGYAQADFPLQDIGNERHIAEVRQNVSASCDWNGDQIAVCTALPVIRNGGHRFSSAI